ncbi:MAG: hypothetical protein ISS77_02305 [Phycisphaerae bacterium]|nr:hypothetical protein [Phycisphaerae bacterium]
MKNSKEYSLKIKNLYKSLKKKSPKIQPVKFDDPLEAIIFGLIAENTTQKNAEDAYKRLNTDFVDINDLRVSSLTEIMEMLGSQDQLAKDSAQRIKTVLKDIFERHNELTLEGLKKIGKKPAKKTVDKTQGVSQFASNYCFLTALGGHSIPLTEKMVKFLKENELVHPDADNSDMSGFLERQISAKDNYEFYILLRKEAEIVKAVKKTEKKKSVKKASPKKTTKTKPEKVLKTKKKVKKKAKKSKKKG